MTCCPVCDTAVATLANVTGVTTQTTFTERGRVTSWFAAIVCDGCQTPLIVETDQALFYTAKAMLRARPVLAQLRVDAQCRDILTREGIS